MLNTVLVATDGSELAGRAVTLAGEIAGKFESRVVVQHVLFEDRIPNELVQLARSSSETSALDEGESRIDPISSGPIALFERGVEGPASKDVVLAVGRFVVDSAARALKSDGIDEIDAFLDEGDTASAILERAETEDADLIVLGCRGYGMVEGALVGSVANTIHHKTERPLLTVR